MKKIIILMLIIININLLANEIYIGDLIKLKISTDSLTEKDIRDKFKDFEIEEIKKDKSSETYTIAIRSFEAGEKNITIGNKNLIIKVKSELAEGEQKDIYLENEKGEIKIKESKKPIPVTNIVYGIVIIISLIIILLIIKLISKKVKIKKQKKPYEILINELNKLKTETFFVEATYFYKKYIYGKYGERVYGKTSREILQQIPKKVDFQKLKEWLEFSDKCKFTKYQVTDEDSKNYKEKLIEIVMENEEQEVKNV